MPREVVTGIKAICAFFGVSHRTMDGWRADGFPTRARGRVVLIVVDEAVGWIQAHFQIVSRGRNGAGKGQRDTTTTSAEKSSV
jgi:hypothetical protein